MLCCDGFRSISRLTRALSVKPVIVPVVRLRQRGCRKDIVRCRAYCNLGLFFAYHRLCDNECRTYQHVHAVYHCIALYTAVRSTRSHAPRKQLNEMQRTWRRNVFSAQVKTGRHSTVSAIKGTFTLLFFRHLSVLMRFFFAIVDKNVNMLISISLDIKFAKFKIKRFCLNKKKLDCKNSLVVIYFTKNN